MKGKPKPYVHSFAKTQPGKVELVELGSGNVQTADVFQGFLGQIDVARTEYQVRRIMLGIVFGSAVWR